MTKETPEALKAKAQALLDKAKELENRMFASIGKIAHSCHVKNFEGFDLEQFKAEVQRTMEWKKRRRKNSDTISETDGI